MSLLDFHGITLFVVILSYYYVQSQNLSETNKPIAREILKQNSVADTVYLKYPFVIAPESSKNNVDDGNNNRIINDRNNNLSVIIPKRDLLIFGAMNTDYYNRFHLYISKNKLYAAKHNYSHDVVVYDNYTMAAPGIKIYAAYNYLHNTNERKIYTRFNRTVDWLVFLDGDSFIAEDSIPIEYFINLANSIPEGRSKNQSECHFIAQDGTNIVNTGFWMIRNSTWGREFIELWRKEYERAEKWGIHFWLEDQGALSSTLLYYIHDLVGKPYVNDSCLTINANHANKCYSRLLTELGYPPRSRKFGNVCLLPESGVPYTMMIHKLHSQGEFVNHNKKYEKMQNITHKEGTLEYKNGMIGIRNGTFIRTTGTNHGLWRIYCLVNKTLHELPNWDTFNALGGKDLHDAMYLNHDYFSQLPVGNKLPPLDFP